MINSGHKPQIDGHWIDYYALLDVPIATDEDAIRRRIGKVYADASANSEHRDPIRRDYYQSLVERVLPQCRRVLLDSEWRARYDHQHALHRDKNSTAQSYVEFIASMRSESNSGLAGSLFPQRAQEELDAARKVVETARSGAELDLLPSEAISNMMSVAGETAPAATSTRQSADFDAIPVANLHIPETPTERRPENERAANRRNKPLEIIAQVQPANLESMRTVAKTMEQSTPKTTEVAASQEEIHQQPGPEARATVITAQEASDIRRRRASNPNADAFVGPSSRDMGSKKKPRSRVVVEVDDPTLRRKLSPTSLNLMVAITGVLLTITIQRFASTPAVATSAGRTPIILAVAPEIQSALESASAKWEKTPGGTAYDVVIQSVDSSLAMQRALEKSGAAIDGWIPATASYAQRYNEMAPAAKRSTLQIGDSLAQTPMVLVARSDKAGALLRAFPDHRIGTWTALRAATMQNAKGRFGLSDPRQSLPGAVARFSMAREWGESQNKSAEAAAKDSKFWKWISGFEENIPSSAVTPEAMVKDMMLGTTGRYWWAISYESDALKWLSQGKALELFYLPRTTLADHPFCAVERVGAPLEVALGRAAFVNYMRSTDAQKGLLQSGFRPTEISPATPSEKNPFTSQNARDSGVQLQELPRDERFNVKALGTIQKQWSQRHG